MKKTNSSLCHRCFESFASLRRHKIPALILTLAGLLAGSAHAQLLHRYSFWSSTTTNDTVGTANGTLNGAATISGGALTTTGASGALVGGVATNACDLPATAVAGITNAFAIEMWFTANYVSGGYSTLFSFSDSTTANYVLATPARGNWPYASGVAIIGGGGSTTEQQAGGTYLDNGSGPHDMIINYDGTNITYYLDGGIVPANPISAVPYTFSDPGLVLSNLTYIGVGGGSPWGDKSMNGKVYDFRIFGQGLTAAQVATIYGLNTNASNAALAAALVPPTAFTWNGGGSDNNWSTGGNWIGGTAPATSGTAVTFAGSTRTSPTMNANYSVTGLTYSNTASSFSIGTPSSTLTLAGDVVNNSANAQTLNVPVALGAAVNLNAAAGNLVLNSNITLGASALTLIGNNNFTLNGNLSGTGTFTKTGVGALTLGGSSLTAGSVSFNGGTVSVSGTVSASGGTTYIGYLTDTAVVNMSGGVWNLGSEIRVGGSDTSGSITGTGTFNVNGGTVNANALTVARGNNAANSESGTVTLNSGSTFVSTNDVIIEFAGSGLGKLALNGGTFIIGPTALKWFMVGYYDSGAAELDITNGNLFLENGSALKLCRSGNAGGDVVNQASGNVIFYADAGTTLGGGGNLDLLYNGGGSGTYNLNGGLLAVPQIIASSTGGSSTFNFNGGTLKPTASSTAFMQGLSAAYVQSGGAIIDTTNYNITIAQTLQDAGGGLTKLGSGALTLSTGYGYSGATFVAAGALNLDASQSSSASALTVSNATLNLSLNNGASSINAAAVTFKGSSILNLNFGSATAPSAAAINASGYTATSSGATVINITGQNLVVGTYPLIYTGSAVSTSGFSLGTLPSGVTAHLNNSGTSLDLVITAAGQSLTWYGASSSGSALTTWDINTSANWYSTVAGGEVKYLQYGGNTYGDNVTFDDTAYSSANCAITLNTTVVPTSVNFNNNSDSYSFAGPGGIGGATSVNQNGAGSIYFGTTNTYAGGTVINAGTLAVVNDKALGSGTVTLGGGTLQFSNSTASSRSFTVVSNSTLVIPANGSVQLSGTVSGGANLSANGGALNLSGTLVNQSVTVGSVAGNALMNISGTFTASNLFVGNVSGAFAAASQTGGTATINGGTGDNLSIGNWDGSFGYFNAAGGTMNVNGINIAGEENPNVWPPAGGGDGILEVNGETINNSGWIVIARGGGPNTGILNMFSGALTYSGGGIGCNWNGSATSVGGTQTSIINVLGGSITSTNEGVNFRTSDQTGILNLNNGLLSATSVTGYGIANFNGGTLKASAASANYLSVTAANIFGNGGTIDDGGYAITVSQPLLAPTGYGVSSVTLSDAGSGYIAPPIVLISGGSGSNATAIAQINLAAGTVTNILVTCPGTGYAAGDTLTVTFSDGGSSAVAPATATAHLTANVTTGGLTKAGSGTLTLDSINTYTGATKVNAGTLAGTGTIAGALTNNATLAPGDGGSGSLTVNGNITLKANSTNVFSVNGTTPANALVIAGGNVNYGGVLQINPSGTFTAGQQFQLFSGTGATNASSFASIQTSGSGFGFAFTNGVLSVISVGPSSPAKITNSFSGGILSLSWPAGQGWRLQMQTNSLSKGLGTNWTYLTDGSSSTNITVDPTKPTVFYRLTYP